MGSPIGVTAKLTDRSQAVQTAAKKGVFKSLGHAGASIRRAAIASMVFAAGPSRPGTPPHAHKGKLRRSIQYAVEPEGVTVGPAYSRVTAGGRPPWLASMHERGGLFKGAKPGTTKRVPARPFMSPAILEARKRFRETWQSSIG